MPIKEKKYNKSIESVVFSQHYLLNSNILIPITFPISVIATLQSIDKKHHFKVRYFKQDKRLRLLLPIKTKLHGKNI